MSKLDQGSDVREDAVFSLWHEQGAPINNMSSDDLLEHLMLRSGCWVIAIPATLSLKLRTERFQVASTKFYDCKRSCGVVQKKGVIVAMHRRLI